MYTFFVLSKPIHFLPFPLALAIFPCLLLQGASTDWGRTSIALLHQCCKSCTSVALLRQCCKSCTSVALLHQCCKSCTSVAPVLHPSWCLTLPAGSLCPCRRSLALLMVPDLAAGSLCPCRRSLAHSQAVLSLLSSPARHPLAESRALLLYCMSSPLSPFAVLHVIPTEPF